MFSAAPPIACLKHEISDCIVVPFRGWDPSVSSLALEHQFLASLFCSHAITKGTTEHANDEKQPKEVREENDPVLPGHTIDGPAGRAADRANNIPTETSSVVPSGRALRNCGT
jgi:hypothetical protein